MALTCIVVDKYGKILSDEELKNKVIDNPRYYDVALPIRKRINDELKGNREKVSAWVNMNTDIKDHISTRVNL